MRHKIPLTPEANSPGPPIYALVLHPQGSAFAVHID